MMPNLINYEEPKRSPYFYLAWRLCEYSHIMNRAGLIKASTYELFKSEPIKFLRDFLKIYHKFFKNRPKSKSMPTTSELEELVLSRTDLDEVEKIIFKKAIPMMIGGTASLTGMKEALEPIVGKGLPDRIRYRINNLLGYRNKIRGYIEK